MILAQRCTLKVVAGFVGGFAAGVVSPAAYGAPEPAIPTPQAQLQVLSDGVHHPDAAVRRHAAHLLADDVTAHGVTLLYILSTDVDPEVQAAALASVLHRCTVDTPGVCAAMVQFFVGDMDDAEVHWQARDWLLLEAPAAATQSATVAYKLDVVARMGERIDQPDYNVGALRVLRLLAEDPDPEVQEAAGAALVRAKL
jgi:hypothetical protein